MDTPPIDPALKAALIEFLNSKAGRQVIAEVVPIRKTKFSRRLDDLEAELNRLEAVIRGRREDNDVTE